MIFGLLWTFRAQRTGRVRAGFVMWGVWLLTFGLIFSKMSTIPHTAYMASLAPPLAALPAAGIVMFWRYYQAGDRRGWLLPIAVAAELAWAAFLWRDYGNFLPWVRTAAVAAGAPIRVAVGWPAGRRGRNSPNGMASARAAMASGLAAAGREPPVLASPPPVRPRADC